MIMKFKDKDKVIDTTRVKLWGETPGVVIRSIGPYRTMVKWPDERGSQLEKNDDLKVVK